MKKTDKDREYWLDDEDFPFTEEYNEEIIKPAKAAKKRRQRGKKCILPDGTRCKKKCADCPKGVPTGESLSYERMVNSGNEVAEPSTTEELFDGIQELETLKAALASLAKDDYRLIRALFYEEKSEREYGEEIETSGKTIHSRKKAILKRLRAFFDKYQ